MKKIVASFLVFLMLFHLFGSPMIVHAAEGYEKPAGYIYWNTAKANAIELSGGNYYRITDLVSYGINTSISTYYGKTYDEMQYSTPSRVTYQKPFEVNYNTTIRLFSGTDGEGSNVRSDSIAWCVIEYDENGTLLYDGNWMSTNQSHTVGVTTGGDDHSGGMRSTRVRYISLVFRYIEGGDFNVGVASPDMTPAELANHFPNLYVSYKPFTYTIVNSSVHTILRDGTTPVSLNSYVEEKPGYSFRGWKITSDSTIEPNWMNGNTYTHAEVESWLSSGIFYNSFWGNVRFTASYDANIYTVTYNANGGVTSAISKSVACGEAVDLSPTASKKGYTFIGWSTSGTARLPLSFYNMPAGDITLYAVYSGEVSDVENHDYPEYNATPDVSNDEVFLKVWIKEEPSICMYYPLTYAQDVNTMVYRYTLSTTDVSDFVKGREYAFQILAYDNAGNEAVLYDGSGDAVVPPEPKMYTQTVYHYKCHPMSNKQILFETTNTEVEEGKTFVPSYVTPPVGYSASDKAAGKMVTSANEYYAYYRPNTYIIAFEANGGTVSIESKQVTYDNYYGELPIPTRTGYTFVGWNLEQNGTGKNIGAGDIYSTAGNQTLFAQWVPNTYTVTYDYWTNGGTSVEKEHAEVSYLTAIDLRVSAEKEDGYTFVGWNTDASASTALSSLTMDTEEVTLYAIFAKTIQLTLTERDGENTIETILSKTIYNNETQAEFPISQKGFFAGWTNIGWSDKRDATEQPVVTTGETYTTKDSTRLYALYASDVTVSYDAGDAGIQYESVTMERFCNASGTYFYPTFEIKKAPEFVNHSFVIWQAEDGTTYLPETSMVIEKSTCLVAVWDQFPVLEVYDRYFTLEQVQNGIISHAELLSKVVARDREDGLLKKGTDVIVKDYREEMFNGITEDTEIVLTYQATDHYGNVTEKNCSIVIVDTGFHKKTKQYVRFISEMFFCDAEGNLIVAEKGGLENTSIWREETYLNLLRRVFSKDESDAEVWIFTSEELKQIKEKSPTD